MRNLFGLSLRLTLLLVLPLVGAETEDVFSADYSAGILNRTLQVERATHVDSARFPDAEEVLIGSIHRSAYRADGTYVQWHEEYIKILTEKARRAHLTLSSHYTIPYQRGPEDCRIPLVEIVKSDGRIVTIDVENQSRTMIDPSSMSQNIYNPNDKIIQVNVAGLEIGDMLHFVLFDRIVQPRMANSWSDWITFESTRPILEATVEIYAPADKPLQSLALKDAVGASVKQETEAWSGGTLHRWTARDVPRMFPEPNMPDMYNVLQRVLVSTNPDWKTVSKWYWDLSVPHYANTDAIRTKVSELIAGKETPMDKIQALFGFVSQEIRYMGIVAESTSPGYEPHDVGDTFSARHGVCRDKAALLVSMLRESGLEAFPTLIHNGPKKDEEVPQPYFNHAIVAARVDGEYVLMDPTDEATRELLPSYLDDRSFLVATPEGDTLRTSPIEPSDVNLMDIETRGSLDKNGNLKASTVLRFNGINDNAYRGYFSRVKPEERRRLFESLIKRASPRARVTDVVIVPEDMQDTSTSLTVNVSFEADETFVTGTGLAMAPLPIMGARVGMVNFIVGKTGLTQRKYPLRTGFACGVREHIVLTLDESIGDPALIPASDPITTDALRWSLEINITNAQIDVAGDFRLEVSEFTPAQYLELKKTLRTIERSLRQMPAFKVAVPDERQSLMAGSDVLYENVQVDYDILGPEHWVETRTVRKRVLTYSGIKKNSELKLSFNPAWEDISLVRATVTAANGDVSEISEKETNIMDAPWVGAAARYPAGKTLVASFPAVAVGSTIEYAYTRSVKERPFFAMHESFASFDSVQHKAVSIHAHAAHFPRTFEFMSEVLSVVEGPADDDFSLRKTWRAGNLKGSAQEDSVPPSWDTFPTLFASSGSLSNAIAWFQHRLDEVTTNQSVAVATSLALVKEVKTAEAKMRLIRDYVATHIRQIGPGLSEMPLSAISSADVTLQDGYGNSTDVTVLLYVMLEAAGLSPEWVVVSQLPALDRFRKPFVEAPDSGIFSSLLVRLRRAPGEIAEGHYYFGDSDQYGVPGATAYENMWAIVLAEGHFAPVQSIHSDLVKTSYQIFVDADGGTRLTKDSLIYGSGFGELNKRYREMTPEERRRHYEELVADISQSAQAVGDLKTDFEDYPGRIRFTVDIADWAIRDGEYLYFSIPSSIGSAFYLRADRRLHPLFLDGQRHMVEEISVECPPNFVPVIVPDGLSVDGFAGTQLDYDVEANEAKGGGVDIFARMELIQRPVVVPTSSYEELLKLSSSLSHRKATTVVLKQSRDTN